MCAASAPLPAGDEDSAVGLPSDTSLAAFSWERPVCEAGREGGDTREEGPGVEKEETVRWVCPDTRDAREMESVGEGGDPGGNESISNKRKKKKNTYKREKKTSFSPNTSE